METWIIDETRRTLPRLLAVAEPAFAGRSGRFERYRRRLEDQLPRIFSLMFELYGWRWDFAWHLESLVLSTARAAAGRPKWLRRHDRAERGGAWMFEPESVWAMAYVERFGGDFRGIEERIPHLHSLGVTHLHLMPPYAVPDGPNDGGYAVESYRATRPELGTIDDLRHLAKTLDRSGISLVLDFVANHTASTHEWARAARDGIEPYRGFYPMFRERRETDAWLPHLREIFPERQGDAFTWVDDVEGGGAWVWTTFHDFQWDLDYRNPAVLVAVLDELFAVANAGASVIRMDATPFLWKQEGTSCENLPQAHTVLQVMNAAARVAAPSVRFLSEAIVHPDDVSRFVRADECPIGYNPLVMALIWEALATRDVGFLTDALRERQTLPPGSSWLTYVRSHDDIGWGFADEDLLRRGVDPSAHRAFLNAFYTGEFEGSFAIGERFQVNDRTGDARISGTTASLAGLEVALASGDEKATDLAVRRILAAQTVAFTSVGMPMLFLGDEIGTLSDHRYVDDVSRAGDNRWMHRPAYDWSALERAEADPLSPQGRILAGVRRLSRFRVGRPSLTHAPPRVLETGHGAVLAYERTHEDDGVLVVVNLSDEPAGARLDPSGDGWVVWPTGDVPGFEELHLAAYETLLLVRPDGVRTEAAAEGRDAHSEESRSRTDRP